MVFTQYHKELSWLLPPSSKSIMHLKFLPGNSITGSSAGHFNGSADKSLPAADNSPFPGGGARLWALPEEAISSPLLCCRAPASLGPSGRPRPSLQLGERRFGWRSSRRLRNVMFVLFITKFLNPRLTILNKCYWLCGAV